MVCPVSSELLQKGTTQRFTITKKRIYSPKNQVHKSVFHTGVIGELPLPILGSTRDVTAKIGQLKTRIFDFAIKELFRRKRALVKKRTTQVANILYLLKGFVNKKCMIFRFTCHLRTQTRCSVDVKVNWNAWLRTKRHYE